MCYEYVKRLEAGSVPDSLSPPPVRLKNTRLVLRATQHGVDSLKKE